MKRYVRQLEHHHRHDRHHHHDRTYLIHLLWAELEYDIKYAIAKRGKMMNLKGDDARNFAYTEQDADWMLRQVETAVSNVRKKMGWAVVDKSKMSSDELLDTPMEYNIVISMPESWLGHADNVMNSAHTYVVNYCVSNYLDMAGTSHEGMAAAAASYSAQAETNLDAVYDEINAVYITPKKMKI